MKEAGVKTASYLDNKQKAILFTPSEMIFFIGAGFYYISLFLTTTMFIEFLPLGDSSRMMARALLYSTVIVKIIMVEKFTLKRLLLYGAMMLLLIVCYLASGYTYCIDLFFLIIGARGIRSDRIIKAFTYIGLFLIAFTILFTATGVITNRIFLRSTGDDISGVSHSIIFDGTTRNAMGFIYPTDFGARVFYTYLGVAYLLDKKFNWIHTLIYILTGWAILYFCDVRVDSILIAAAGIVCFVNAKTKFFEAKWCARLLPLVMPVLYVFVYFFVMSYKRTPFWYRIDSILTHRIAMAYYNVLIFGIKPFGTYLFQQGHGVINFNDTVGYNFVDIGYMQSLIMYGPILTTIAVGTFAYIAMRAVKRKQPKIALIIAFIAATTCIDHHFLESWYDPFILFAFANLPGTYTAVQKQKAVSTDDDKLKSAVSKPIPQKLSHRMDVWGSVFRRRREGQ